MDAEGLMIGDFVKCSVDKAIYKVVAISKNYIQAIIKGGSEKETVLCHNTEPLPLTEDVLLANGFRCLIELREWYYRDENGKVVNFYLMDSFGGYSLKSNQAVKIAYVHELQHALRLCGLNRLADSFKVV